MQHVFLGCLRFCKDFVVAQSICTRRTATAAGKTLLRVGKSERAQGERIRRGVILLSVCNQSVQFTLSLFWSSLTRDTLFARVLSHSLSLIVCSPTPVACLFFLFACCYFLCWTQQNTRGWLRFLCHLLLLCALPLSLSQFLSSLLISPLANSLNFRIFMRISYVSNCVILFHCRHLFWSS